MCLTECNELSAIMDVIGQHNPNDIQAQQFSLQIDYGQLFAK
jgi:hypothetical protein